MAKKTFKDAITNPAMNFITPPEEEQATVEEAPEERQTPSRKPPAGYKLNRDLIETKSRRLQLMIQPSLYERVKEKAEAESSSVNDWIHQALEKATKGSRRK